MALSLVEVDGDGGFKLNDAACDVLRAITDPVAVVAVCGPYRSGKSFLLNRMAELASSGKGEAGSGFGVGSTVQACTSGIHLYEVPRKRNGVRVLLLDVEGFGATDNTTAYDCRVFSLAVLLCSCLVYNSKGSIDELSVQQLAFISQVSKHMKVAGHEEGGAGGEDDVVSQLPEFFPSFRWVLRDFCLDLVDESGFPITQTEYMDNCLCQKAGFDSETMAQNRTRSMLCNFFRDRECHTLVRPVEDEVVLQNLDSAEYSTMRPEFRSQLESLVSTLFEAPRPKQLHGKPVTGEMLASIVRSYVDAVNGGGVPCIADAWTEAVRAECMSARDAAAKVHAECIASARAKMPWPSEALHEELSRAADDAAALFDARTAAADRDSETKAQCRDELRSKVAAREKDTRAANSKASEEQCTRLIEGLFFEQVDKNAADADLDASAFARFSTLAELWQTWEGLAHTYADQAVGPSTHEVLARTVMRRMPQSADAVQARVAEAAECRVAAALEAEQEARAAQLAAIEKLTTVEKERADLQAAHVVLNEQHARASAEAEGLRATAQRLRGELEKVREEFREERARLAATVAQLEDDLARASEATAVAVKEKKALKTRLDSTTADLSAERDNVAEATRTLERTRKDLIDTRQAHADAVQATQDMSVGNEEARASLAQQLSKATTRHEEAARKADEAASRADAEASESAKRKREIEALTVDMAELRDKEALTRAERVRAVGERDAARVKLADMGKMLADKEAELKEAQKAHAKLSAELKEQVDEGERVRQLVVAGKAEKVALQAQLEEGERKAASLQAGKDDLEQAIVVCDREKEVQVAELSLRHAEKDASQQKKLDELAAKVAEMAKEREDTEALHAKTVGALKARVVVGQAAQEKLDETRLAMATLTARHADELSARDEAAAAAKMKAVKEVEEEHKAKAVAVAEVHVTAIATHESKTAEAAETAAAANKALREASAKEQAELQGQLKEAQATLADMQAQDAKLRAKLGEAEAGLGESKAEALKLQARVELSLSKAEHDAEDKAKTLESAVQVTKAHNERVALLNKYLDEARAENKRSAEELRQEAISAMTSRWKCRELADKAIALTRAGGEVTKYSFNKATHRAQRWLAVNAAGTHFAWGAASKHVFNTAKQVPLSSVKRVILGSGTPNFTRHRGAGGEANPAACFSIRCNARTYDFVASSSRLAVWWVFGLRCLCARLLRAGEEGKGEEKNDDGDNGFRSAMPADGGDSALGGLLWERAKMAMKGRSEGEIKAAFKNMDKSGDGAVPAAELRHILAGLSTSVTDEEAEEMARDANGGRVGDVVYAQLVEMLAAA